MKNTKKTWKIKNTKWNFTSKKLSLYGGIAPIIMFIEKINIPIQFDTMFPTIEHNARKFTITQLMLSVILASLSGVCRLTNIANFTDDPLVQKMLGLIKGLNKDVISTEFKKLGECGARRLENIFGQRIKRMLKKSKIKEFTLDADSTVKLVYGKQQGAAKGYNPGKKGGRSYHPLLVFATELKIVVNSWFRTGSAYTSNGIIEFLKQTVCYLPEDVKVLFRADSGFFSGELFDYLEKLGWNYLVKVKFKGMKELFKKQDWKLLKNTNDIWVCQVNYQGTKWKKARPLKVVRRIKEYKAREEFGKTVWVPVYQYAAYCSSLNLNVWATHIKYTDRAVSETWIEQVKSQLYAGTTLTQNFWANDILWQLAVFAYNLSLMMRLENAKLYKEEHRTFREWFIKVAAQVSGGKYSSEIRLYKYYPYRRRWEVFAEQLVV